MTTPTEARLLKEDGQEAGACPSGPTVATHEPSPASGLGPSGECQLAGVAPAGFTDEYRATVCRVGQGEACCRYLTMGGDGWACAKQTTMAWTIDQRADTMRAKGDNCYGVLTPRPAFRLKADRFKHKAGTIIYRAAGHDYGCASDDEAVTGKPHTSMTLEPSGAYPFFTVPDEDFEPTGAAK